MAVGASPLPSPPHNTQTKLTIQVKPLTLSCIGQLYLDPEQTDKPEQLDVQLALLDGVLSLVQVSEAASAQILAGDLQTDLG